MLLLFRHFFNIKTGSYTVADKQILSVFLCLCASLPDTPPYVVWLPVPTLGQGEPSAFSPIKPETVLVAVTPSAPPLNNSNRRYVTYWNKMIPLWCRNNIVVKCVHLHEQPWRCQQYWWRSVSVWQRTEWKWRLAPNDKYYAPALDPNHKHAHQNTTFISLFIFPQLSLCVCVYLSTGQSHASFTHPMRTRQIQLQCICSWFLNTNIFSI